VSAHGLVLLEAYTGHTSLWISLSRAGPEPWVAPSNPRIRRPHRARYASACLGAVLTRHVHVIRSVALTGCRIVAKEPTNAAAGVHCNNKRIQHGHPTRKEDAHWTFGLVTRARRRALFGGARASTNLRLGNFPCFAANGQKKNRHRAQGGSGGAHVERLCTA